MRKNSNQRNVSICRAQSRIQMLLFSAKLTRVEGRHYANNLPLMILVCEIKKTRQMWFLSNKCTPSLFRRSRGENKFLKVEFELKKSWNFTSKIPIPEVYERNETSFFRWWLETVVLIINFNFYKGECNMSINFLR